MRVLTVGNMYPPHHLGGYELMWRSAVGALRAGGHTVRVLTTDYRAPIPEAATPEDEDVHRALRWYWRDHELPPLGLRGAVALERSNAVVLRAQLRDFDPEIVSWWAMGGMSLSLLEQVRRAGLPASAVIVDDWLSYGPVVDRWTGGLRESGRLTRALAHLVRVPTRLHPDATGPCLFASHALRRISAENGWSPPSARVAHPGIDHGQFSGPRAARDGWGWRILYCGRIDERKGIDTAIEALTRLPAVATLTVVGGGDRAHGDELRSLAERLGVAGRVSFERHPRDRLPELYRAADATVFPVRWAEPFGLVPLESMAMGTPVVATGRGGSAEYLRDGENCALFDADAGAGALAKALTRMAGDADLRVRLNAGGLATAAQHRQEDFDRAVEEELLAALERLSRPPPRAGS